LENCPADGEKELKVYNADCGDIYDIQDINGDHDGLETIAFVI
jgi:hypothetical protein